MSALEARLLGALAAADETLFVREGSRFRLVGPRAPWLDAVWRVGDDGLAALEDAHVVLAEFVSAGDRGWSGPFGVGGEIDSFGATWLDRDTLRLERLGPRHAELRSTLQRGREVLLELEALQHERDRREVLLHAIVHDLGGPLSATVSALDALVGGRLAEERRDAVLAIAARQARAASELTRQILDIFRAELAALDDLGPAEGTPLGPVVDAVVEAAGRAAAERGVAIELAVEPGRVAGTAERVRRMLQNLAENALRYAPRGSAIRLEVAVEPTRVVVAVVDRGPGVPLERRAALFERLARGPEQTGKLGLGLYFVRLSARRLGGDVMFEEPAGGGARFSFWLPRRGT